MKKLRVVNLETRVSEVHYEGAGGNDYTLCGDTLDECAEPPEETTQRVTCASCRLIVEHVRGTRQ